MNPAKMFPKLRCRGTQILIVEQNNASKSRLTTVGEPYTPILENFCCEHHESLYLLPLYHFKPYQNLFVQSR